MSRVVCLLLLAGCRIGFDERPPDGRRTFEDAEIAVDAVFGMTGDLGAQRVYDVAVGSDGSIAVVGAAQTRLPWSDAPARGDFDAFVASIRADGRLRWIRQLGGPADDRALGVAIHPSGDLVISGYYGGTADLGTGQTTASGDSDMFLASLSADGTTRWMRTFGGPGSTMYGSDQANEIAIAPSGQIYMAGQFVGPVDFGTGPLTMSAGGNDVVLAAFDRDGSALWVRNHGGGQLNKVAGLGADDAGPVFTGYFQGTASFGGAALSAVGSNDIFVAAYAPDGAYRWARGIGGDRFDFGRGVTIDATGDVYVTGYYQGTVDFGDGPRTAPTSDPDGFIVALSAAGAHRWSRTLGAVCAKGQDIAVAGDRILVAGEYVTTVAAPPLTSTGPGDAFVLALGRDGSVMHAQTYGGDGYDIARAVAGLADDVLLAGDGAGGDGCRTVDPGVAGEDLFVLRASAP